MSVNFPASPSVGQTVTDPATGAVWRWTGDRWTHAGGETFVTQEQLEAAIGNTAAALGNRQNRNRLINGGFLVNQRFGSAIQTPTVGGYVSDRWALAITQPSRLSTQQYGAFGLLGPGATLEIKALMNYAPVATDFFALQQTIEYQNINDLRPGTGGDPVTLSFSVRASVAGTYSGALCGANGARSYPFTFDLPSNVWTFRAITIPADTMGTWYTSADASGMYVRFDLGSGANFRGPSGSWQAANLMGANGAVSLVGDLGASLVFSQVQLERGTQATPFDYKSLPTELQECQRYFAQDPAGLMGIFWCGNTTSGVTYYAFTRFVTQMRTAPIITLTNVNASGFAMTSGGPTNVTRLSFTEGRVANAAINGGWFGSSFIASAEL